MPAIYDGLQFKTKLEARWAAFFDLAKWEWRANPAHVGDWQPDFRVKFPCKHSKCCGSHSLLVSVIPVDKIEDASNHPALEQRYNIEGPDKEHYKGVDAGAVFGTSPKVSRFEFAHGPGSGVDDGPVWVNDAEQLWARTAFMVS